MLPPKYRNQHDSPRERRRDSKCHNQRPYIAYSSLESLIFSPYQGPFQPTHPARFSPVPRDPINAAGPINSHRCILRIISSPIFIRLVGFISLSKLNKRVSGEGSVSLSNLSLRVCGSSLSIIVASCGGFRLLLLHKGIAYRLLSSHTLRLRRRDSLYPLPGEY